jgi:membrane-bound lytic murein transglycosylase B
MRYMRPIRFLCATLIAMAVAAAPATAQTPKQWVEAFWPTAKSAGIKRATYDRALGNFTPDPDVLKRASAQAEFNMAIWNYMDQMVSDERISEGTAALKTNSALLDRIENRYGIDRYTVLAIWGMESHYGAVLKNPKLFKHTIPSLATLAYSGGRLAKFGRQQLIAALKIIQRGDVTPEAMTGSWAGAMGQTQFIPTTFEAFAVDFDGDGHRNIWTSEADALASAANYLRESGWQSGATWGYEVTVPSGYDIKKSGERTLGSWADHGVVRVAGKSFPRPREKAKLYLPNGRAGPAFVILRNFGVIKHYNNANTYALAVGHLSDRLRGGGPFVGQWPEHEKPFSIEEGERLQAYLTTAGYYSGPIDGNLGSGSRQAIRDFQRKLGMNPDGVATRDLLRRLEAAN